MENNKVRNISSGAQYEHLFPKATMIDYTVKRGATVADTVRLIPKVVAEKKWQAQKFVDQELKGLSTYDACRKLWEFVYRHIDYKKDEYNLEQIRTVARSWHDRFEGVDCDCYTTFIACCLSLLKIPVTLRITKYEEDRFQHIYPIVPLEDGKYITMDCVVHQFNYEEPFTEKQDTPMDLQILDGVPTAPKTYSGIDAEDLLANDFSFGELGKINLKKIVPKINLPKINLPKVNLPKVNVPKINLSKIDPKGKIKAAVKQTVHTVNRVNPATLLLRNGVLASMKLNLMNVAGKLKWTYLSQDQAAKRGMDIGKWQQLKTVREKLEKIFFGAGGKPENLKQAILSGKGNASKEVPLSGLYNTPYPMGALNDQMPLQTLLGREIYYSENVEGMEGFGQLGEPVSAAAIAAASAAIATVAGLIKNIGDLFPKKDKTTTPASSASSSAPVPPETSSPASSQPAETIPQNSTPQGADEPTYTPYPETQSSYDSSSSASTYSESASTGSGNDPSSLPASENAKTASEDKTASSEKETSFWEKNKNWIKPTAWAIGGLSVCVIAYKLMAPKYQRAKTLTGINTRKKHIRPIALL